ncbi:MAG: alcohol dehydrogenase catalytic domain-containing protein [Acidobacteria bacterium]|nr:alcohol dehydrogenase catalytic domain-containing protein [Acidobacteriota bacterium]
MSLTTIDWFVGGIMTSEKMTAVVVTAPGQFEIRDVAVPVPGPDDVLIRVHHSSICGSDLRLIKGSMEDINFPLIPGHEWSGEVVEAPERYQHLVGQLVVSDILQSCDSCRFCLRGYRNLCDGLDEPGISVNGAFAEYIIVRARNVYSLPIGLPTLNACMVEPLSVVLYALELLPVNCGERVAIFGGGGIGQLLAQAVKIAGASKVVIIDHHDERLSIAKKLGADEVINSLRTDPVLALSGDSELGPDLVFDAAGNAEAFLSSLEVVNSGGRVGVIGYSGRQEISIRPTTFMRKLIQVQGVLSPTSSWTKAIDLISRQEVKVGPLLTHQMPLKKFPMAFKMMSDRAEGIIRPVLQP